MYRPVGGAQTFFFPVIGFFSHFCLFQTDSVAFVDLIGPEQDDGVWSRSKAFGSMFDVDLSKDAPICDKLRY